MHIDYLCKRYQVDPRGTKGARRDALNLAAVCCEGGENQLASALVRAVKNSDLTEADRPSEDQDASPQD